MRFSIRSFSVCGPAPVVSPSISFSRRPINCGWMGILLVDRVDDRLRIKVTDTALSRDLYPDDYHCLGDNENRPIKWMALESVANREYSTASDVVR